MYHNMVTGNQIMSGETVQCMVDMMVSSLIPASATVVLMLHSTQVTAMVVLQKFEGAQSTERDVVHGPLSVVYGPMIITSLQATVSRQNVTETEVPARLIAIMEFVDLQIGIPTVTVKDLDTVTVNDKAIDHAHGNIVPLTVKAAMGHSRAKTVMIG